MSRRSPAVSVAANLFWIVAVTASLMAGYLTYKKWIGEISDLAGCGAESGCSQLLGGRWANWLRVPISFWAAIDYASLAVLGLLGLTTGLRFRMAASALGILLGAALWFVGLQVFVEHQFCWWCLSLHTCSVALLTCFLLIGRVLPPDDRRRGWQSAALAGAVGSILLVSGQYFGPQPTTHEITEAPTPSLPPSLPDPAPPVPSHSDRVAAAPAKTAPTTSEATKPARPVVEAKAASARGVSVPPTSREVVFLKGELKFDLADVPLIGDPAAPHVIVKYFDYTCQACRKMHDELDAIQTRHPHELAVIVIPCPLDHACNPFVAQSRGEHRHSCELAKLALCVWRADRSKFVAFHNGLFARQAEKPTGSQIRAEVIQLIGQQKLEEAEADLWIAELLDQTVGLYRLLARLNPRMPKLLLGDTKILHGLAIDEAALEKVLQEQVGLSTTP